MVQLLETVMKRLLLVAIPGILWFRICAGESELTIPSERLHSTEAQNHGKALFLKHYVLCHGKRADIIKGAPAGFQQPGLAEKSFNSKSV